MLQRLAAFVMLVIFSPLILAMIAIVGLTSPGPVIFRQKRTGKDKKPFDIYKVRTMVAGAESLKEGLRKRNEAAGPVFKIRDDPRYTKVGKFLAHSGLDELPQLWNIAKGEMAFIGPRPLPVSEAVKVPKKYERRFSVLPGISSLWVIKGTDHSSFRKWMELDLVYVKDKSTYNDLRIALKTAVILVKLAIKAAGINV